MKCVVVCYYVAEVYVRIAALPLLQGNAFLLQLLHTQAEIGTGLFITGQEVIREFSGHNGGGLTLVMLIRIVIDKTEDVLIYQTTTSQSRHHDSFKNQIIIATDTTTYQQSASKFYKNICSFTFFSLKVRPIRPNFQAKKISWLD
jgi:hypothetical protein